jgi:hypothetical protein
MNRRTDLPPHKHPLVLRETLRTLGDHNGNPTSNRAYHENERGLERWGWNQCNGEPDPKSGKRIRCEAGQVRKNGFLYRCGACRGQGGWHGDPYDRTQQTVQAGTQKPSTFTVTDYTVLILDMDRTNDGGKAIDRAVWMLETRLTLNNGTSTTTPAAVNPAITQLWATLAKLHTRNPSHHGIIRRVHIEQWTPEHTLGLVERTALRHAITHLARLLPDQWCAPRHARLKAQETIDQQRIAA